MPAPYIVNSYATSYSSTGTSKSVSISCNNGDSLLVIGTGGKNTTLSNASASGITFNTASAAGSASSGALYTSRALQVAAQTNLTVSMTESSGTVPWGFTCFIVRNCYAAVTSAITSTSGLGLNVSTRYVRNLIITAQVDADAVDGSTRTWNTFQSTTPSAANSLELSYNYVSGNYTTYIAAYPTSGAGTYTGKPYISSPTINNRNITIMLQGDDTPITSGSSSFAEVNYAATTSRSTTIGLNSSLVNTIYIASAHVGVQPGNGTDTGVTTTMTIGGLPMTSLAKVHSNGGTQGYVEVFYRRSPPTGNQPVVLTASTSVDLRLGGGILLGNVNQTTPFSNIHTASGSSTTAGVTFTSPVPFERSLIYVATVSAQNFTAYNNTSPSFQLLTGSESFNNSSDGGVAAAQLLSFPQPSENATMTLASSGPWAAIAFEINPTSYFPPQTVTGFVA